MSLTLGNYLAGKIPITKSYKPKTHTATSSTKATAFVEQPRKSYSSQDPQCPTNPTSIIAAVKVSWNLK